MITPRNTLVRYHGSMPGFHGLVLRVLGGCHCDRHPGERRLKLAYRNDPGPLLRCVRQTSVTRVTVTEADAIERAAHQWADAETARLRDLDPAPERGPDALGPDAFRWSPTDTPYPL